MTRPRNAPAPDDGTGWTEIAAGTGLLSRAPSLKPQKNRTSKNPLARARDRHDFARTARARLRYALPDESVPLTEAGLRRWLPKLDLTEKQYARLVDMKLADTVRHNAHWPLVSWLGLILELCEGAES